VNTIWTHCDDAMLKVSDRLLFPPGVDCQVLVDYCAHVTCENGAVCNNTDGGALCACEAGFTGTSVVVIVCSFRLCMYCNV